MLDAMVERGYHERDAGFWSEVVGARPGLVKFLMAPVLSRKDGAQVGACRALTQRMEVG